MELTWVAIIASLCMALAAVCIFIFAVRKDYFHNIEDTKYQVFWSDLEELVDSPKEKPNGNSKYCCATLDLARRTFTIVRQNLFWAFAYNVVGITLAMAGVLNPILAAAAMVLSSLSVIGNSRRLAKG